METDAEKLAAAIEALTVYADPEMWDRGAWGLDTDFRAGETDHKHGYGLARFVLARIDR